MSDDGIRLERAGVRFVGRNAYSVGLARVTIMGLGSWEPEKFTFSMILTDSVRTVVGERVGRTEHRRRTDQGHVQHQQHGVGEFSSQRSGDEMQRDPIAVGRLSGRGVQYRQVGRPAYVGHGVLHVGQHRAIRKGTRSARQ